MNGESTTPEASMAKTCPLKVGEQSFIVQRATRVRRPDLVTAVPMPSAPTSSQTVVPVNDSKACWKGMMCSMTHMQLIIIRTTKSGMKRSMRFSSVQTSSPATHIASVSRPEGGGDSATPALTAIERASSRNFLNKTGMTLISFSSELGCRPVRL